MPDLKKGGFLITIQKKGFLSGVVVDSREEALEEADKFSSQGVISEGFKIEVWERIDVPPK